MPIVRHDEFGLELRDNEKPSGLVGHALTAGGIVERAALLNGQLRALVAECSIRRQVQPGSR